MAWVVSFRGVEGGTGRDTDLSNRQSIKVNGSNPILAVKARYQVVLTCRDLEDTALDLIPARVEAAVRIDRRGVEVPTSALVVAYIAIAIPGSVGYGILGVVDQGAAVPGSREDPPVRIPCHFFADNVELDGKALVLAEFKSLAISVGRHVGRAGFIRPGHGEISFAQLRAVAWLHGSTPVVLDKGVVAVAREIGDGGTIGQGNPRRRIEVIELPDRPCIGSDTKDSAFLRKELSANHQKNQHQRKTYGHAHSKPLMQYQHYRLKPRRNLNSK